MRQNANISQQNKSVEHIFNEVNVNPNKNKAVGGLHWASPPTAARTEGKRLPYFLLNLCKSYITVTSIRVKGEKMHVQFTPQISGAAAKFKQNEHVNTV